MPLINYIGNRQECLGATSKFVRGNAPTPPSLSFDYLVVGGGGYGIPYVGGGAGGFLSGSSSISFNDTLYIQIGTGSSTYSTTGQNSYISSSIIGELLAGGGAASGQSGFPQNNPPGSSYTGGTGGSAGGGGGGASEAGFNAIDPGTQPGNAGAGGDGLQWLDGNYYAGGGGGGTSNIGVIANAAGGLGGGGTSLGTPNPNYTASVNSGGGAGFGNGSGGSGIVIIRYLTSDLLPPYDHALSGGTLSVTGSYAYLTFTASAQLSYRF